MISDERVLQLYFQNPTFGLYLMRLAIRRMVENERRMMASGELSRAVPRPRLTRPPPRPTMPPEEERPMPRSIDPFAPATAMLDALRRKQISSAELTELHIGRIQRYDTALNAIVVRDFDRTRSDARAADESAARGEVRRAPRTADDAQGVDQRGGASHHVRGP